MNQNILKLQKQTVSNEKQLKHQINIEITFENELNQKTETRKPSSLQ